MNDRAIAFWIGKAPVSCVAGVCLIVSVTAASAQSGVNTSDPWQLSLRAVGPIHFGMHVYDAAKVLGAPLDRSTWGKECYMARPRGGPQGLVFTIREGRVARVDIWQASVSTLSGVRVGDREADVLRRYSGRLQVSRDKYSPGNTLEFVPKDPSDRSYRVVFKTDGSSVHRVKAGLIPEINSEEGCGDD